MTDSQMPDKDPMEIERDNELEKEERLDPGLVPEAATVPFIVNKDEISEELIEDSGAARENFEGDD